MKIKKIKYSQAILLLLIVLGIATLLSLGCGRYGIGFGKVMGIVLDNFFSFDKTSWTPIEERIVEYVRLPRVLLAVLVGIGLSVSGVAAQGFFRNPLVDSGIIGVGSAASFGGVLAMFVSNNFIWVSSIAFVFGLLSVVLLQFLAKVGNRISILTLILSGCIITAFFGAGISIIKLMADPHEKLPSITYWLMGSLSSANYSDLWKALLIIFPASWTIYMLRFQINIISLGEERATMLGVPYTKVRWILFVCIALITATIVSTSGGVGWVGLMIPHIVRPLVGPEHGKLIPASALVGGLFLLLIDNLARVASAMEIPIGLVTSLIGVPFLAFILKKTYKNGWNEN